jgi:uncharacterized protein YgiM (DUF1202 family)
MKRIALTLTLFLTLTWCFLLPAATADLVRVVVRKANVRTGQNTNSKIVSTFVKGDVLNLLESDENWHKVSLTDGREGWIFAKGRGRAGSFRPPDRGSGRAGCRGVSAMGQSQ